MVPSDVEEMGFYGTCVLDVAELKDPMTMQTRHTLENRALRSRPTKMLKCKISRCFLSRKEKTSKQQICRFRLFQSEPRLEVEFQDPASAFVSSVMLPFSAFSCSAGPMKRTRFFLCLFLFSLSSRRFSFDLALVEVKQICFSAT